MPALSSDKSNIKKVSKKHNTIQVEQPFIAAMKEEAHAPHLNLATALASIIIQAVDNIKRSLFALLKEMLGF